MKKILIFIFALFIMFCDKTYVKAFSAEKTNFEIVKGSNQRVDLYVNALEEISSVSMNLIYYSNDVPGDFFVDDVYTDDISGTIHNITFDTAKTGRILLGNVFLSVRENATVKQGSVYISGSAYGKDGSKINLDSITLVVDVANEIVQSQVEKVTDYNLLKEIKSSIFNIELEKDVFEYNVSINSDIEKLDLEPVCVSQKCEFDISNLIVSELEDNKITIKVTDEDIESVYTINVNIKEKKDSDVTSEIKTRDDSAVIDRSYKNKWLILMMSFSVLLVVGIFINRRVK